MPRTQSPETCVARHAIRFQGPNVPNRRKAEATAVLTTELADAFVSNLVGRGRRIQAVHQHPLSRSLKPEHLLVLQRTHGRQCTKLVMERGNAQSRRVSKFFDMKRFREIGTQPGDGSCSSLHKVSTGRDSPQAASLRSLEQAVDDFALDQRAKKRNVLGG